MRVIAGSAKRLQLKTPDGPDTRPTTDRIKETLFNMLAPDLYGRAFLDLFACSGAIGRVALRRGEHLAVFIELSPKAVECIYENLRHTHLEESAQVRKGDVLLALRQMRGRERFDFVFMDPPYGQGLEEKVLRYLSTSALLNENALIIVEAALRTSFPYLEEEGYVLDKEKKYKTNKHVFLRHVCRTRTLQETKGEGIC